MFEGVENVVECFLQRFRVGPQSLREEGLGEEGRNRCL